MIRKKTYVLIVILAVLAAASIAVWDLWTKYKEKNRPPQIIRTVGEKTRQDQPRDKYPVDFPKGLPVGEGVQVRENYTSSNPQAMTVQTVYQYTTSVKSEPVFADFQKYFNANSWTVHLSSGTPDMILSADQEMTGRKFLVTVSASAELGTIVNLNLIEDIPSGWPKDLPIEQGAGVSESAASDGTPLREYISSMKMADLYRSYSDYFAVRGWYLQDIKISDESRLLSATKLGAKILTYMDLDKASGKIKVQLGLTVTR